MQIRRLSATLGAEITGVDLSAPLDDATFAAIRETWLHNKVVVFPEQNLDEEALMRFGRRFGELEIHVRSTYHSRHNPEVMMVSNKKEEGRAIGVLGDGEAVWHIDQSYMPHRHSAPFCSVRKFPPKVATRGSPISPPRMSVCRRRCARISRASAASIPSIGTTGVKPRAAPTCK